MWFGVDLYTIYSHFSTQEEGQGGFCAVSLAHRSIRMVRLYILSVLTIDIMNTRPRASSDQARQRAASTTGQAKLPSRDVTEPTPLQALLAMQADKLLPEGTCSM